MWVYFDMDGTIASLYDVQGWLDYLINEQVYPYAHAPQMEGLSELVNFLNNSNINIGIVSWGSRDGSRSYTRKVRRAKIQWLRENFKVDISEIHVVKYGTPKHSVVFNKESILFDDEQQNVDAWNRCKGATAYKIQNVRDILDILDKLIDSSPRVWDNIIVTGKGVGMADLIHLIIFEGFLFLGVVLVLNSPQPPTGFCC